MAEAAGVTVEGIHYQLRGLQEKGLLTRIGGRKFGHWEVLVENTMGCEPPQKTTGKKPQVRSLRKETAGKKLPEKNYKKETTRKKEFERRNLYA